MAKTIAHFCDDVVAGKTPSFCAEPWYNTYGDCIHYHWRPDEYIREWVDDKLTVYRSAENKEAVGCQIKGIKALLKKMGDWGLDIDEAGGMRIAMFLFVSQNVANPSPVGEDRGATYRYLLEKVGKASVTVEVK